MPGLGGAGAGLDDMLGIGSMAQSVSDMKPTGLWVVTFVVVGLAIATQTLTGGHGLLEVLMWLAPGWGAAEWTLVGTVVAFVAVLAMCCWTCMFGDDDLGGPWSLDLGLPGPFYRGGYSRNIAGTPPEPGATGLSNLGNTW